MYLIQPNFPGQIAYTRDLMVHYSNIMEQEVAVSCEWYCTHTIKDYYWENLQLPADLIENNTTDGLWENCIEAPDDYPSHTCVVAHRVLLSCIMMRLLQSHSETAIQYLINSVKNLQIRNFEGEDVGKVVSLIQGAHKRLKLVMNLPVEFSQWVLQVLQKSSVQAFNKGFLHLQRNIEVVETLSAGKSTLTYQSIENMLRVAQKENLGMKSTNKWSGLTMKANQSAFVAQPNKGEQG
jgi:hypothetical protein